MFKQLPLALITAAVLSACAVGPDYQRPDLALPTQWPGAGQKTADVPADATQQAGPWWRIYQDPVLDRLQDEALNNNVDARLAVARIAEAQAQLGIANADLLPSLSANMGGSRTKVTTQGATPLFATVPRFQNNYTASLNTSYELDLWGKLRRASESARAQLLAMESAQESVRLTLTAQVAQAYFALITLDRQEALLKQVLQGREESLELDRKRLELGAMSEFDLNTALSEVALFRSQLANITQLREQQEAVLALLVGRSPRDVMEAHLERGAPANPGVIAIPEGLTTDILLQRPDVQEAEQRLVAMNANIGYVRAQMFPSVSLTAFMGGQSAAFSELFTGPAGVFQFAGGIALPLFNAGKLSDSVRVAEAQREQALITYQHTVASAFADVRNALSAQEGARRMLEAATLRSNALARSRQQVEARYRVGASSRLDVLNVERDALQAEMDRLDAERLQRNAVSDFYKAVGGA